MLVDGVRVGVGVLVGVAVTVGVLVGVVVTVGVLVGVGVGLGVAQIENAGTFSLTTPVDGLV
jgi:hypothetical protein